MMSQRKRFAVLGSPIGHSLSPKIHNLAYERLGFAGNYEGFEVKAGDLSDFLKTHPADVWSGFSLTMPLKEIALELVTDIESSAARASSINTLLPFGNSWQGLNTDIFGFRYLFDTFDLLSNESAQVAILGAGGTARAALVALDGFPGPVSIYRRSSSRDQALKKANPGAEIIDWEFANEAFQADVLINALPREGIESLRKTVNSFQQARVIIDALYHPWPTLLSGSARDLFLSGKDLLVAQALRQIELFTGADLARGEFFKELRAALT